MIGTGRIRRKFRQLMLVGVVAVLFGCGSSPAVRYYNLEPIEAEAHADNADTVLLGLGPLGVPQYMTRQQLVTRGRGTEMIVDDFSRWAEPLDRAIHRVLAVSVDTLMNDVTVVPFPYNNLISVTYRLVGDVERFDVDESGRAVLIVQWGVGDTDGRMYVSPRRSRFESQASSNGPDAIVQAMANTAAQFSREIATELAAALP